LRRDRLRELAICCGVVAIARVERDPPWQRLHQQVEAAVVPNGFFFPARRHRQ